MPTDRNEIARTITESAEVIASLTGLAGDIAAACDAIDAALARGGTIYTCGNGGSAAEALHLSEELIGKFRDPRPPLRAICLNADPTAITCIANDFGFDEVFARQAQALARPGDVLVVFSTSGNSRNIVRALEVARDAGATTIGLLGKSGGPCLTLCDHAVVVPSDKTERIQEAHQLVLHIILDRVEATLAERTTT